MIYSFLQYRTHEPDKRFYDFGSHGAAFPPVQRDTPALLHVADENFLHLGCCFGTVHECVYFEIMVETAEIEVGRTDCREFIVDDQAFGMQESSFIKIYFYTCPKNIFQIRLRSILQ